METQRNCDSETEKFLTFAEIQDTYRFFERQDSNKILTLSAFF